MTKFGNSMYDALLQAMVKEKSPNEENQEKLSNKQKLKLETELKSKVVSKPTIQPAPAAPSPPTANRPIARSKSQQKENTKNLFYNASKRSTEEILADFSAANTSRSKRKGIIQGVEQAFYSLQKKGASPHQILEYQELLAELRDRLKTELSQGGHAQKNPIKAESATGAGARSARKGSPHFTTQSQFSKSADEADAIDTVIGLDFGTSCTKVVVRTPYERNLSYLVPFKQFAHPSNQSLLPTQLDISEGSYVLPVGSDIGKFQNLKLEFINNLTRSADDNLAQERAIAYVARVFQYVRTWFLTNCRENYPEKCLRWWVNVGVPSATAEKDDVCELYEKTAMMAWAVSMRDEVITSDVIAKVKNDFFEGGVSDSELVDIKVCPEVAAEVVGYTQSDLRQEGLHLMVDVGAGTLDVCGFNVVHRDGITVLPIFTTSVEARGAKALHLERCDAILDAARVMHTELIKDAVAPINTGVEGYIPDHDFFKKKMGEREGTFYNHCLIQIKQAILDLKKRHDPRSNKWTSKLPLFLCGGGSQIDFFKRLHADISQWMVDHGINRGLTLIQLPKPEELISEAGEDSHYRFGVAWGLSYAPWEMDEVMTNLEPVCVVEPSLEKPWWGRATAYRLMDD